LVRCAEVEIYNEFSLQHELGCHIRRSLPSGYRLQFERPVDFFFGTSSQQWVRKEIDIVMFSNGNRSAIELKFPRNGQYPEQMFSACKDIRFLEQLVDSGFGSGYFVMAADDPLFYRRSTVNQGIYRYFRANVPISGLIPKPTGKTNDSVSIRGSYAVDWRPAGNLIRYCIVAVNPWQTRKEEQTHASS
ncbi:MAG: hypothetical protein ACRD3T_13685, partial [Terriglobia bacterium]